jgi:hypothetical protein
LRIVDILEPSLTFGPPEKGVSQTTTIRQFLMKNVLPALTAFVVLALLTAGCGKEEQAEFDRDAILKYLDDNSLTATEHDSGIFYIIETPGTGGSPSLNSTITFKYKGYYLDGVVFDQTTGNNTATYPLSNLIQGWQIVHSLGPGLWPQPAIRRSRQCGIGLRNRVGRLLTNVYFWRANKS